MTDISANNVQLWATVSGIYNERLKHISFVVRFHTFLLSWYLLLRLKNSNFFHSVTIVKTFPLVSIYRFLKNPFNTSNSVSLYLFPSQLAKYLATSARQKLLMYVHDKTLTKSLASICCSISHEVSEVSIVSAISISLGIIFF